ncbi:MAG: N-acetylmuramoyl-L-alanine amidase, partial [Clostridiales bacterium]|nr:N-acetylmuramoyl-L-alanine amidase [Clostridiales bacterium]
MSEFMKIRKQYVTPNPYSRPQKSLKEIRAIVVHWVANPNTTDINNRDFFEGRKRGESGYGSAHEIIDLDGSIVIAIPEHEMA